MSAAIAPASDVDVDARIDAVRRFNRLYTRRIGVLQHDYLRSPYSLAEVRVLYELAHHDWSTATELARELDLDQGYLSRILRNFLRQGLLERSRSEHDGREWRLSLTAAGLATFGPLQTAAREQIGGLLRQLSEGQQQRLVRAMGEVESLLADTPEPRSAALFLNGSKNPPGARASATAESPAYVLRDPLPGDFGWVVQRHGALYAQEYGWDTSFEALVAGIVAKFVDHFNPARERCWIAERYGEPVGCVFLVKASKWVAKLRLFLIEPDARGRGIGRHMVDELIAFARAAGYRTIRLWTQSVLLAARHIYARAGFRLVAEESHHSFGADLVAETWELRL